MMTLRAFRKIQIGEESSPGTPVAAAEVGYGTLTTFEEERTLEQPDEDRGSLARNMADDFFTGEEAHLVWTGDVNTRHILYALSMAIRGNISPTQPDSTNQPLAYLWTFAPGLTTANTPDIANGIDTFTIEFGDTTQAYEAEYCFATRLEISGAPNAPCKFTCDITGRQQTDTTFTGALTAQTVQRFPFNLGKFYIDTSGAGLGGTQKTSTLKGFTWTLETMFVPRYTADGNLYFAAVDEDKKKVELSLIYAWGATADAERTKYEGRTTTFPRIELLGATELDSGQSNPPYVYLDLAIRYTSWPTWGQDAGLSTCEVTAESVYDSTWAKMFEVAVLTELDAFP
jgi:hypothetical protein